MRKVFECKMCGKCCKGRGGIYLGEDEIETISSYLKLNKAEFKKNYLELKNGKLRLIQNDTGYCIFYSNQKQCSIHEVKPSICRLWPFFRANIEDEQSFFIAKIACPGIDPECSHLDFVKAWHEIVSDGA